MSQTQRETRQYRLRFCITLTLAGYCLPVVVGCATPREQVPRVADLPATTVSWEEAFAAQTPDSSQTIQHASWSGSVDEKSDPNANVEAATDNAAADPINEEAVVAPIDPPHDLQTLIATALATHPRIAAARQKVAAVTHRIPQATALSDPMFSNTFWPIRDQALQTAGGRYGNQMTLSQKVPWPSKLQARGAVARREVQVAQAEVANARREITEAVRLAYYELWLTDEIIRIVKDNQELVRDLITVAKARYKAGGSQQDILRAELEGDKLEDQLIALRRQKEQARADLGTLVRQPIEMMPVAFEDLDVAEIEPQLELLIASAEQSNPALQGLAAEIARDKEKETLACLQQYPDLQFGVGWALVNDNQDVLSPVANGHDNVNFTVGVTLPIWRDRINAAVREAAHERTGTIYRREAERDRLRGELRRQVAAARAAIEQLELFRERLVPRTEQTLTIATADYQGNKTDFFDLIDIYRELLTYQIQVARTKATLASTYAQIERAVGRATLP